MSPRRAVPIALVLLACTPRPWNYDETDRISQVMGNGEEDPEVAATVASLATPELPDVIPYPRPVYVRPSRETRRTPTLKGKRSSVAERAKGVVRIRSAEVPAPRRARASER